MSEITREMLERAGCEVKQGRWYSTAEDRLGVVIADADYRRGWRLLPRVEIGHYRPRFRLKAPTQETEG